MPTNDERREVATRLRSVTGEERELCFTEEILAGCIGTMQCLNEYDGTPDEWLILQRLADLIEPEPINGETSDGYHTFDELYHHRAVLFSVIVRNYPELCWKSKKHYTGDMYDGMFIVGINTPDGQASYHYNIDPYWDMFDCKELEYAPKWDGHTPQEAIERIGKLGSKQIKTDNELKSCPFCGGKGVLRTFPIHGGVRFYVACESCECSFAHDWTKEEAIAAWNTRAERMCKMEECELTKCDKYLFVCSECNSYIRILDNYCPGCGAKVAKVSDNIW